MQTSSSSRLGTQNISSLMVQLAVPSILAYLVNILYNIVDRIYIGHLASSSALTGVGICLPILQLVSAFCVFAGNGGAPLAAIELGKSEKDSTALKTAEKYLGNAFILLCIFSTVLMSFFLTFKNSILLAFGASQETLPYASSYISIYLLGTFFVQFSVGLNPFITCQGRAKTAMTSTLIGAVSNLILDPVFIFGLSMGVSGAALATIISQGLSAAWVLRFLTSGKSVLRLRFEILRPNFSVIKRIASLGISPFIMQATESAIFVVFNTGLQKYGGDIYVGAMTIMQSVMQMIWIPASGFTNGVQPIISYNFGARKNDRVKGTIYRMLFVCGLIMIISSIITTVFPEKIAGLFTGDKALLEIEKKLLPVYIGAMWIMWIQTVAQTTFVGIGNAKVSVFIACLRKLILLIPLALILPHFFGVEGIYYAEPVASCTSAVTSGILLYFIVLRKM